MEDNAYAKGSTISEKGNALSYIERATRQRVVLKVVNLRQGILDVIEKYAKDLTGEGKDNQLEAMIEEQDIFNYFEEQCIDMFYIENAELMINALTIKIKSNFSFDPITTLKPQILEALDQYVQELSTITQEILKKRITL